MSWHGEFPQGARGKERMSAWYKSTLDPGFLVASVYLKPSRQSRERASSSFRTRQTPKMNQPAKSFSSGPEPRTASFTESHRRHRPQ